MSNEMLSPVIGSPLRVENKEELDDFLSRPDAVRVVKAASFEEVFFTIKHVGIADSLELLPLISGKQIRGFIDLDCWRKDTFVRKPFMEWIAAFIQAGPEETMKAISGVDDTVTPKWMLTVPGPPPVAAGTVNGPFHVSCCPATVGLLVVAPVVVPVV